MQAAPDIGRKAIVESARAASTYRESVFRAQSLAIEDDARAVASVRVRWIVEPHVPLAVYGVGVMEQTFVSADGLSIPSPLHFSCADRRSAIDRADREAGYLRELSEVVRERSVRCRCPLRILAFSRMARQSFGLSACVKRLVLGRGAFADRRAERTRAPPAQPWRSSFHARAVLSRTARSSTRRSAKTIGTGGPPAAVSSLGEAITVALGVDVGERHAATRRDAATPARAPPATGRSLRKAFNVESSSESERCLVNAHSHWHVAARLYCVVLNPYPWMAVPGPLT